MNRSRLAALCSLALVAAAAPALAGNGSGGVTLHPSGFGPHSYAAWKGHQGEADDVGNGAHALYFQKNTATATAAAGVAVFNGIESLELPAAGLELGFDRRLDGWCGAGAPRFNVTIDNGGVRNTIFVGCQGMAFSAAQEPSGWERRSTTLPSNTPGTVVGLAIIFDEGNDLGSGQTWLDNIQVDEMRWTGPADNSKN